MADNKFLTRLKGKQAPKSSVQIDEDKLSPVFGNMPVGSDGLENIIEQSHSSTVVAKGAQNWYLSGNLMVLSDSDQYTSEFKVNGQGLWVNSSYTFTSASVVAPSAKWVLRFCGDNLLDATDHKITLSAIIKAGSTTLASKTFVLDEQANFFCKVLEFDLDDTYQSVHKFASGSTLTVQLLCANDGASATIYNGKTTLTLLQRMVDADTVAFNGLPLIDVMTGHVAEDYFNRYQEQVVDGDKGMPVFSRAGTQMELAGWEEKTTVQVAEHNESETAHEDIREEIATKQDQLTAGYNITIDENNVISATSQISTLFSDLLGDPYDNENLAEALNAKADETDLQAHINDKTNPHEVTKAQVGLGNADNTADLDKPISTATQAALDLKADDSDLQAHIADTDNPHSVTKAQVGLGNVDNTSDADKPISTATQTALDAKQDTISDLSTIRSNASAGKSASDTIATYGDIVTHNTNEFATAAQGALADSALQSGDNVSELTNDAGYITSAYHDSTKQDQLTAGTNVDITDNVISATDTTYSAGNGLTLAGTIFSANVIDTTTSDSTINALSARVGKVLQEQINNLNTRGKYLSIWNCTTGLAMDEPPVDPYTYETGSFFIVGVVAGTGGTNYKPSGSTYSSSTPSTVVETELVKPNDTYYYDGTTWRLLATQGGGTVAFSSILGSPYDNTNLSNALGAKANSADLATVATSGSYNDLSNKPTIPAAQVPADWNATTGVARILNKPTLATVATSGSYNDLANKPTIPTVPTNVSAFTNDAGYVTSAYHDNTKQDVATAVNYDNISNCITEIPQDIKLELNNGTLTLKAGSRVYVPNGAGVFDTYTVSSDTIIGIGTGSQTKFIFIKNDGTAATRTILNCYSGSTAPLHQTNMAWYDTTNNLVKLTSNGGSTWTSGYGLPIAVFTMVSSVPTSIDQVFNGFGYIGSTVFVLPGVKGLIPNGRNADGSLKSTEVETSKVSTSSSGGADQKNIYYGLSGAGIITLNGAYSYDYINNYTYDGSSKRTDVFFGKYDKTSGQIVNFRLATAFHAVDYNDADFVVRYQEPTAANNYTWYRKYKSGWVEQGKDGMSFTTTATVVSLPIEMADMSYQVITTKGGENNNYAYAYKDTTTSVKVKVSTGSAQGSCGFIVVGMAK